MVRLDSEKAYEEYGGAILKHNVYVNTSRVKIFALAKAHIARLCCMYLGSCLKQEGADIDSGTHVFVDRIKPAVIRLEDGRWMGFWRGSSATVGGNGARKGEVL